MNNNKVVEQIQAFVNKIEQEHPVQRDIIPFNLKDIQFENNFMVGDVAIGETALKKVLNALNVKPEFTEYQKTLPQGDFALVANKLKEASGDIDVFGSLVMKPDYTYEIDNIYFKNVRKKKLDDMTGAIHIIKNICDEVAASDVTWKLDNIDYTPTNSKYTIRLSNQSDKIEALKDDLWTQGHQFVFNSTQFQAIPYFERQICTNGMMKKQMGFSTDISKGSFYNEKLTKVIQGALSENNQDVANMIMSMSDRAKNVNVSLAEFYDMKSFFEKHGYNEVADKYFNEAPFFKAFGDKVNEMTVLWKKTANSGINMYDFINLNTYFASHKDKFNMIEEDALALKLKCGDLFTKKAYDLEALAPAVDVQFPRFSEMD